MTSSRSRFLGVATFALFALGSSSARADSARPPSATISASPAGTPLALASPHAASPASQELNAALSLETAVTLALELNERAAKANLRVDAAEGQVVRARSAFLPSLTAGTQATFRPEKDRSGRNVAGSGTVQLSQPLIAPSALPLYSQAKSLLEAEQHSARQDRRTVGFDTARAFLQAKTTERLLEAAKQRLARAAANAESSKARAEAGLASTNDATRASLEVASSSREVVLAIGNVERARLQLGFLLGRPLVGALAESSKVLASAERAAGRADELARAAESKRPDVLSAHARTEAARDSAKEPLYRLAPTLGASALVRVTPDALVGEPVQDTSFLLSLSWALFDGGARYGDRRQRLAQAESTALDEKLLRRSVAVDVGLALASLEAARESYRIAGEAVEAAQKNGEETLILYNTGLARALELTTANAQRFDAEVSRATAKLSMEQAYLELRFALGLDVLGEDAR